MEDSLRAMFSARVAAAPPPDDVAAYAIRRARALRRRQGAASSVAAAAALALILGGAVWLRDRAERQSGPMPGFAAGYDAPAGTPAATPGLVHSTRIGLDLRVRDRLWTADGRNLALDGVGEVRGAYRVPAGWIYGGASQVRLLREDGVSTLLTGSAPHWVVSQDGRRLAALSGTALRVATIGPAGLTTIDKLAVPAGATPVAFLGERVVLAAPPGRSGHGFVDPRSPLEVSWRPEVVAVYGPRAAGMVALVTRPGEPGRCLAELRAGPGVLQTGRVGACATPARADGRGSALSPRGDRLAEPGDRELTLLDVERALQGRDARVGCPVRTTVPPAWADGGTVVGGDDRGVVRCGTDGTHERLPLPPGVGPGWRFVPRLVTAG
ncbi:hypothetical protein [Micromonospora pattaloongensis]|uniref:hypothetical protein n=1 Tax=Micromonospora pattaloongensis TaxID=405436 RepID=UPI0011152036|nr:hypothetical protein [Micromonospora pattaloongensis]